MEPASRQSLTQHFYSPAPRQSISDLTVDDYENYTGPKTRSQTRSLNAPVPASNSVPRQGQLQSVTPFHALQNGRIDKNARYGQASFGGAIIDGKTVRVRVGPHLGRTGVVKSNTKNGAHVEFQSDNKIMLFGKKQLELITSSDGLIPVSAATAFEEAFGAAPAAISRALPNRPSSTASQAQNVASPPRMVSPYSGIMAPPPRAWQPQPPQTRVVGEPKVYSIARPVPNKAYMEAAHLRPSNLNVSRPLLVILDLNGTLLHRKTKGSNFKPRPHLDEFLEYLFSNHSVMVWSSARPHNVINMCKQFFTPEQFQRVTAIWTRDNLQLTPEAYSANTQVYKQLSWVWRDVRIQAKNPVRNTFWSQSNTVLLDDSVEKSASEPYNLIRIGEFENRPDQQGEDVLPQVALYLNTLRSQRDVSAYIRTQPFVPDPSMPRAASEAFAVARHAAMFQSPYLER